MGLPYGARPPEMSPDELREKKVDQIKALAERFIYDLGLFIAGHDVNFGEYLSAPVVDRFNQSVAPFRASGDIMRPNFGDFGDMRIQGNLLDSHMPVLAHIEFDDQSVRETKEGDVIPQPKRHMLLNLVIEPDLAHIRDAVLQPAVH
jgi:hypothetical protein